jgi:hypothetical protein
MSTSILSSLRTGMFLCSSSFSHFSTFFFSHCMSLSICSPLLTLSLTRTLPLTIHTPSHFFSFSFTLTTFLTPFISSPPLSFLSYLVSHSFSHSYSHSSSSSFTLTISPPPPHITSHSIIPFIFLNTLSIISSTARSKTSHAKPPLSLSPAPSLTS